jgi:hypothetical protein
MPLSLLGFMALLFTSGLDVGLIMLPLTEFPLYARESVYAFANPLAIAFGFWGFLVWGFYFLTTFYFLAIEPHVRLFEIPSVKLVNNLVIIGTCAFTAHLLWRNLPFYVPSIGEASRYVVVALTVLMSALTSTHIRYVRVLSVWSMWLFGTLVAVGSYTPPRRAAKFKGSGVGPTPAYSYTACAVELEVDPETGDIRIDHVWVAHDGGTAINPLLVEGQVEGSIYMGLGEALMEESAFRVHGLHKIPSMLEYKSPTTLETPEITTLLVETRDPEGPFGAKEAGQGPLLPVIPAVANAVYDAVGVRIDEVPITPEKILKALDLKARGKAPRVGPERLPPVEFPEPIRVPPPWVDPEGRAAGVVHGKERARP